MVGDGWWSVLRSGGEWWLMGGGWWLVAVEALVTCVERRERGRKEGEGSCQALADGPVKGQ